MGTVDNPDIYVNYSSDSWPPSEWTDLFTACRKLHVETGNAFKASRAEVTLKNPVGNPLTSGENKLALGKYLKIDADVRGTSDNVFFGKIYRIRAKKVGSNPEYVTLNCYGIDRKLLEDTITKDFREESLGGENWTMDTVIQWLLMIPDSGVDTGFALETDDGLITSTPPMDNFDQTFLQDAIKKIADEIGYDGYFYMNGNTPTFYFKTIGTVDPAVAVTLAEPFVMIEPDFTIENVGNHIFIWGDLDIGYPIDGDMWTEKNITTNWADLNEGTVSEDTEDFKAGTKSARIDRADGENQILPMLTLPESVDLTTGRYSYLTFAFTHRTEHYLANSAPLPMIRLIDTEDREIRFYPKKQNYKKYQWYDIAIDVYYCDINADILNPYGMGLWAYEPTGENNGFEWNIKKIGFITSNLIIERVLHVKFDGLHFQGGYEINPLKHPDQYPDPAENGAFKDDTSISAYGRMVAHEQNKLIKSFEQAGLVGDYVLASRKDPLKKVTVKKGAYPYLRANQKVTLTYSDWDITSETWRTIDVVHDWDSKTKLLRATMELVPQNQKVNSQDYIAESYEGLMAKWGY